MNDQPPIPLDLKAWLDHHVVPLLAGPPPLQLHAFLHRSAPDAVRPDSIYVWLLATSEGWGPAVKRLLESGFAFDYLREPVRVPVAGAPALLLLGGDGAPFIGQNGMAIVRLVRRTDDGVELLVEVGHRFPNGTAAAAAVRAFFALFPGVSPFELIARFRPPFGGG